MGIPPTRRAVELFGCSIFAFGVDGLLPKERAYFDVATLLQQLGLLSMQPTAGR